MMARTLTDLMQVLEQTGLPYTQVDWLNGTEPNLPYIVLRPDETSNWFADGTVNETPVLYMVELYTRERDVTRELTIQSALNAAGIGWERVSIPVSDGRALMTRWYMHVFER